MFQKIKNWFFKKEEVSVSGTTKVELSNAVFKAVPENYNPVKSATVTTAIPAITTDQLDTITNIVTSPISYGLPPAVPSPVYTAVVTNTDQQSVVNAAEGSATQAAPEKKARKPRKPKSETVEMKPAAAWPFPTEKPLAAVTPEELAALKVEPAPAAMKAKKPRKSVVPKQG